MITELTEGVVINGRYRLLLLKGRGTFGEVWQARDIMLGIEVAVKVYVSLDAEGREEFKEEYRLAVNLNHSNLLAVTYFDEWEGRPFLVMRYCARGSVAALVGKMSEAQLWAFLREVASGLAYLHSLQPEPIVHQDIKPDNILVDDYGHFLISDFGISKKIRATMRKQSGRATGAGAMAFMGPERFSKEPSPIKASDIWSLGVTICELATGELPFCGMGGGMLKKGAEMPSLGAPWSDELNSLMQACLSLEPWDRPTAAQIAEYAAAKMEGRGASIKPSSNSTDKKRQKSADSVATSGIKTNANKSDKKKKRTLRLVGGIIGIFIGTLIMQWINIHNRTVVELENKHYNKIFSAPEMNRQVFADDSSCSIGIPINFDGIKQYPSPIVLFHFDKIENMAIIISRENKWEVEDLGIKSLEEYTDVIIKQVENEGRIIDFKELYRDKTQVNGHNAVLQKFEGKPKGNEQIVENFYWEKYIIEGKESYFQLIFLERKKRVEHNRDKVKRMVDSFTIVE